MQFSQNHKNTVMPFVGLKTKYTWIKFLAKAKKIYLRWIIGLFPKYDNFSERFDSVSFWPLRSPNFRQNFRKILWPVSEIKWKLTYWHTGLLTYWDFDLLTVLWDPSRLKKGVQKCNLWYADQFLEFTFLKQHKIFPSNKNVTLNKACATKQA